MVALFLRTQRGRVPLRNRYSYTFPCSTRQFRISLHRPYSAMAGPYVEYKYVEDVERLSNYCNGGYHPININDRLHDRYRVVHKLGHGTFSTVWLAHDANASRYVAVKVGTAYAERTEVDALLDIQSGISTSSYETEKASLISMALDYFTIQGPNGTHPCFVTTPARCSLRELKAGCHSGLFQLDVARSLAAQLVIAVSLVHSHGYAHGGTCCFHLSF